MTGKCEGSRGSGVIFGTAGLCIGGLLEVVNAICAFLLPPLLVILPTCFVLGLFLAAIKDTNPNPD